MDDPSSLIPPVGSVSQVERLFRVNWVAALGRSSRGAPMVMPGFVARQGRRVRLVDLRDLEALLGPLGYIPGADWVPEDRARSLAGRVGPDEPIILISRTGDSAKEIALDLERHGLRFVAAMNGGMMAWHDLGFSTSRDPAIAGRLDQLRAVVDAPPPAPGPLSLGEVEGHVGDPFSIRWLKLAALLVHGRLSCVDGRDDSGVIGTPGGDGGEFLMALVAVEHATGRHLDLPTIGALIERRLDAFGRFYMHTDLASANRFIASMRSDPRLDATLAHVFETIEWRKFMAGPPPEVREVVLEHLIQPAHFGCGHVRMMLTRSDEYGVRPELVKMFMRSFMMARWAGSPHLELVPLAGGHAEGAVLNVRTERPLYPFSHVPLVSPLAAGSQMFINHPQVASFLRDQLAAFLAQQSDLLGLSDADIPALRRCMEDLAGRQLGLTLGALAAGLPVYELLFRGERVSVKLEGSIPA